MVLFTICKNYIFAHYLAHERSPYGTCECGTIENCSYSLARLSPCVYVYCAMDQSFTFLSSLLRVSVHSYTLHVKTK